MRCNFLILCEYAARLDRGGPVLAGIFRRIQAETYPFSLEPIVVACEVEVDPPMAGRSYVLDLVLTDEDGRSLYESQVDVNFDRRGDNGPSYCYFSGPVFVLPPIERPGLYRFDLHFNGESIAQARLDISP